MSYQKIVLPKVFYSTPSSQNEDSRKKKSFVKPRNSSSLFKLYNNLRIWLGFIKSKRNVYVVDSQNFAMVRGTVEVKANHSLTEWYFWTYDKIHPRFVNNSKFTQLNITKTIIFTPDIVITYTGTKDTNN